MADHFKLKVLHYINFNCQVKFSSLNLDKLTEFVMNGSSAVKRSSWCFRTTVTKVHISGYQHSILTQVFFYSMSCFIQCQNNTKQSYLFEFHLISLCKSLLQGDSMHGLAIFLGKMSPFSSLMMPQDVVVMAESVNCLKLDNCIVLTL